ncbi:bifunctional DNA primase/polymerase [Rhodococcus wratislaviensis]|uniref:bifunctional DNA primase/polymerase n=1 Tax=Rhodococcus wratislaviensis TaxID=44752 RepID=UPI0035179EEB
MNADDVLGSRAPGDKTDLGGYVRALAEAGLHIVLVEPNAKAPLDMRSPAARREDDEVAQAAAKAAGNPRWVNVRSSAGVHLATTDTGRLDAYVAAAGKRYGVDTVNLGVEVGRSRLVVVDADNGADVEAFQAAHAAEAGETITPTVDTPGKRDASGTWVHKDGGHFWFTVPEGVELPEGTGAYTVDGWTAYYANRQVLMPPSSRDEGPYAWRGGIRPLPTWLHARITAQADVRTAKAAERTGNSPIDAWASVTPWADLLAADGWAASGRVSTCGCPEWTAPGPHDSRKSATAHEVGCTEGRFDAANGHAPLHVWTDNPPAGLRGGGTYSKAQYVAAVRHDGDLDAACTALGIPYSDEAGATWDVAEAVLDVPVTSTDPHDPELMRQVFEFSPVTAHILEQARIRLVGPWSALLVALAHATVLTPWWVRLPAIVGGDASINSLVALVGGSGAGKGISAGGGGKPILSWPRDPSVDDGLIDAGQTVDDALTPITVGSGEALATLFRDWRKVPHTDEDTGKVTERLKLVTIRRAAWVDFSEIDQVTALMRRESSTLSSELRKLWDGKALGVHTKSVERRSEVAAFTYRAAVTFGVQPERAEPLLAGEDGGLPQRLVWVSTSDPAVPDEDDGVPDTLPIPAPSWKRTGDDEYVYMGVTEAVRKQIRADRRAVQREAAGALTGIDAHRNLVRLKLAAAVAVLHGRADVSDDDWELAGLLLEHSDRVRAAVRKSITTAHKAAHEARGAADVHRAEGERATRDKAIEAAAVSIHGYLSKRKGTVFTARDIKASGKPGSPWRLYCAEALAVLVDEGAVAHGPDSHTKTTTYQWNADRGADS